MQPLAERLWFESRCRNSDYTGFTILLQDEADHGGPAAPVASSPAATEPTPGDRVGLDAAVGAAVGGGGGGGEDGGDGGGGSDGSGGAGDGGGGLEVDINGRWVPVAPLPGAFVVNTGDLFELWTNNRWRSTPHRVASPRAGTAAAARSRLTAMLFTGPALQTVVQPAPTCGPSLYPTLTAREHLAAMATTKSKESHYARQSAVAKARARPQGQGQSDGNGDGLSTALAGPSSSSVDPTAPKAPMLRNEAIELALAIAAGEGHLDCTQLLLNAGVPLSIEAIEKALRAAEVKGKHEVAAMVSQALASARALSAPGGARALGAPGVADTTGHANPEVPRPPQPESSPQPPQPEAAHEGQAPVELS